MLIPRKLYVHTFQGYTETFWFFFFFSFLKNTQFIQYMQSQIPNTIQGETKYLASLNVFKNSSRPGDLFL